MIEPMSILRFHQIIACVARIFPTHRSLEIGESCINIWYALYRFIHKHTPPISIWILVFSYTACARHKTNGKTIKWNECVRSKKKMKRKLKISKLSVSFGISPRNQITTMTSERRGKYRIKPKYSCYYAIAPSSLLCVSSCVSSVHFIVCCFVV